MSDDGDHESEENLLNKQLRSLWNRTVALMALMTGLMFFFAFYLIDKGRFAIAFTILILLLILVVIMIKVTLNKAYAMQNKRIIGRKEYVHEGFMNLVTIPLVFGSIFGFLIVFSIDRWGILSA